MKLNEKEIDKLLTLLDNDSSGIQHQSLLFEHKITNTTITKAQNMGFIRYYDESTKMYRDSAHNQFHCKITEEGSRTLNRYGGFENILKYDRASRMISYSAFTVAVVSLVITLYMAFYK